MGFGLGCWCWGLGSRVWAVCDVVLGVWGYEVAVGVRTNAKGNSQGLGFRVLTTTLAEMPSLMSVMVQSPGVHVLTV